MSGDKVTRRDQVKELIETGLYTKQEIADKLGVQVPSVSSQMTYLGWMGFFIMTNADKKLSFCTKEEYEAKQNEILANRKTKNTTAVKTPQEQANALAKTLKTQRKAYEKAQAKLKQIESDINADPNDEELVVLKQEAEANATLLRIKISRNEKRASELPAPVEPVAEETVAEDVNETEPDETDETMGITDDSNLFEE